MAPNETSQRVGVDAGARSAIEQQQADARVHQDYEVAFATDHGDVAWETRAKRMLNEKLPGVLPEGSSLRSFECHAMICRLEMHHADRERYWQFVRSAFVDPSSRLWNAEAYTVPLNDDPGDGLSVTYIARENEALPQFVE
jgi:hypothetical protein